MNKSLNQILLAALAAGCTTAAQAGFLTSVTNYTVPTTSEYSIIPLLSVNDRVPLTGDATKEYRMIGIPDGLGAHANNDGTLTLFMNHELRNTVNSQPVIGGATNRGAFVSQFIHAADGSVLSGKRAYDSVFVNDTYVGPAAEVGNSTPAFGRFCSGSLAWQEAGFDRPIFFAGEESDAPATFSPKGGVLVAIYDNEAHAIPEQGYYSWENAVVRPDAGPITAVIGLEDGPSTPDSQLWMYVGYKNPGATSVLERNGLNNGDLYVFVANRKKVTSEFNFTSGQIQGKWVKIPNAGDLTAAELEAAADAVGAFGFIRIEDGEFSPTNPNEFYFVTTGSTVPGSAVQPNLLGRGYKLELNEDNVLGPAKLRVLYNADQIVAAGGDIALSPDNVAVSGDYLMIQEDGTGESRPVIASKGRKGGIWRINLITGAADYVAEMTGQGRSGPQTLPGVWETSGIIDVSGFFGTEAWLFDTQAHSPTPAPAAQTVEDGQLLIMIRNP